VTSFLQFTSSCNCNLKAFWFSLCGKRQIVYPWDDSSWAVIFTPHSQIDRWVFDARDIPSLLWRSYISPPLPPVAYHPFSTPPRPHKISSPQPHKTPPLVWRYSWQCIDTDPLWFNQWEAVAIGYGLLYILCYGTRTWLLVLDITWRCLSLDQLWHNKKKLPIWS